MKLGLILVGGVVLGGAAVLLTRGGGDEESPDFRTPVVNPAMHGEDAAARAQEEDSIVIPELSPLAQTGREIFQQTCAACHGENANGTENGPTFIHQLYVPAHHSDQAFWLAARTGVRAHHWRFGDMPPVDGVTDKQLEWIVQYVREMQRANGVM